ncbi:MAG TPA: methyltransferase domain-containing protein [Phnomibacter sp.]|nr:methyltransferase domain-containing protein [Phnomibacter sp.]
MSRYHSYLNSAEKLIHNYKGDVPFSIFIKQFFAANKQMGSRDRKAISQLCYQVFRLGHFLKSEPAFKRIIEAAVIFAEQNAEFLKALDIDTGNEKQALDEGSLDEVFPFAVMLSEQVDKPAFQQSILQQPDLFLRIRPGAKDKVLQALETNSVPFKLLSENSVSVPTGTDVAAFLPLNRWAVIQDWSSQKTGEIMAEIFNQHQFKPDKIWDCCAASGGKSIMLHDLFPEARLTATDVRESILGNLQTRFEQAGIKRYETFVADLTLKQQRMLGSPFDLVIADLPCTGSGTWARTPENLVFFEKEMAADYASRQYAIANEALRWLRPQGYFVYITCSVFAEENEKVVEKLLGSGSLKLHRQQLIPGWHQHADSMFIAVMQKA